MPPKTHTAVYGRASRQYRNGSNHQHHKQQRRRAASFGGWWIHLRPEVSSSIVAPTLSSETSDVRLSPQRVASTFVVCSKTLLKDKQGDQANRLSCHQGIEELLLLLSISRHLHRQILTFVGVRSSSCPAIPAPSAVAPPRVSNHYSFALILLL